MRLAMAAKSGSDWAAVGGLAGDLLGLPIGVILAFCFAVACVFDFPTDCSAAVRRRSSARQTVAS
jgi:hypothetical protein